MSFFSFLSPLSIELKVSYPTTFLKLLSVTDSTTSLTYVGDTLRVTALTSSIGISTFWEFFSRVASFEPLVAIRLFEAGAILAFWASAAIGTSDFLISTLTFVLFSGFLPCL